MKINPLISLIQRIQYYDTNLYHTVLICATSIKYCHCKYYTYFCSLYTVVYILTVSILTQYTKYTDTNYNCNYNPNTMGPPQCNNDRLSIEQGLNCPIVVKFLNDHTYSGAPPLLLSRFIRFGRVSQANSGISGQLRSIQFRLQCTKFSEVGGQNVEWRNSRCLQLYRRRGRYSNHSVHC